MVERGHKYLIFMSRSAGSMTSKGVLNLADVKKVVISAAKPIARVLQASMVIDVSSTLV